MKTIARLIIAATFTGITFLPSVTFAEDDQNSSDPAQFARGAQAWADHCGRCHNVRAPTELNDSDWHVSVTHMRVRGNIPGDVARDIMVFLKASNDKK